MAAFIAIDGVWTLLLYRSGAFHRWVNGGGAWRDVPGAVGTTFCSCMTQAPVATRSPDEARAVRWLAWAGWLRPMLIGTLLWLDPRVALAYVLAAVGWGWVAGRVVKGISPAAVFLVRRPPPGLGNVVRDSLAETWGMLRAYAWVLALCAIVGALATRLAVPGWALLPVALVVPVDLLATMPTLIALHGGGTPAWAIATLGAGAVAVAIRPRRLVRSYLRQAAWSRWGWIARGFPLVVAATTWASSGA